MTRICGESEASLDYYSLFRAILKRTPQPMSPLESLASSAVRTAHKVGCTPFSGQNLQQLSGSALSVETAVLRCCNATLLWYIEEVRMGSVLSNNITCP